MADDLSPWTHTSTGKDAANILLPQPIHTDRVEIELGFRSEMETLFFDFRGCEYDTGI